MATISPVIKTLRIHQWTKNLFIFLPLFFGGKLTDLVLLSHSAIAFAAFCCVASAIYCFNDLHDAKLDRMHPRKKTRPIASGEVSKRAAIALMATLILAGTALVLTLPADTSLKVCGVLAAYLMMNIAYTFLLKQYPILDVIIIALGFVLRLLAGSFATGIQLSQWIVIMTFLLALFLAMAKRREEVVQFEQSGEKARANIGRYNRNFLDNSQSVLCAITMVAYIMYTLSDEVMVRFQSAHVYCTSLFVLSGMLRYMQLCLVDNKGGDPSHVLLKDRFIGGCILGWIASFAYIIYF